MAATVSILIPAYNAAEWLGEAIESALAQTWGRKEIIVVDDGSIDETLAVARKFESPLLKVVSQNNQGASKARNKALTLAQGDYIQWLDADDLLEPRKISHQLENLADHGSRTLLSSAWGRFSFRKYHPRFVLNPLWQDLSPVDWLAGKFEKNAWMASNSWLVSRELTEAAGPWNTELTLDDDGEYFARLVSLSDGIKFCNEAKSLVRRASFNSLSTAAGLSKRKLESQFQSMKLQIGYLLSRESSARTRKACVTYLQNWFLYFYPECDNIVVEARKMANGLGGELLPPKLSFKYEVLRRACGWPVAKRARFAFPQAKAVLSLGLDKCLFHLGI